MSQNPFCGGDASTVHPAESLIVEQTGGMAATMGEWLRARMVERCNHQNGDGNHERILWACAEHFKAMAPRAFRLPVSFIGTDSAEIENLFPQFRPFLHGWGEIFGVRSGRCNLFFSPDGRSDTFSFEGAYIYKHYEH
jgi:hypothetical protein